MQPGNSQRKILELKRTTTLSKQSFIYKSKDAAAIKHYKLPDESVNKLETHQEEK